MSTVADQARHRPRDHVVAFYDRDDALVDAVSRYVADALRADEVVVIVATEAHAAGFVAATESSGIDVAGAMVAGRLLVLDAAATMARFIVDGKPDEGRFHAVIGGPIRDAVDTGRPVRAYGEMVALLWDDGQVNAALELENLWNDLGWAVAFSLFCAYPEASVSAGGLLEAFGEVCGLHSSVVEVPGGWSVQRSGVQHDEPFELIQAFDVDRDAPRRARHFVVDALDCWTRSDLSSDAAIVVTELATNAVIHARSRFTVTVARTGAQVRIEVRDSSADLPTEVPPGRGSSGRGVPLVAALTADWGAYRVDDGKVVWATLGG